MARVSKKGGFIVERLLEGLGGPNTIALTVFV